MFLMVAAVKLKFQNQISNSSKQTYSLLPKFTHGILIPVAPKLTADYPAGIYLLKVNYNVQI